MASYEFTYNTSLNELYIRRNSVTTTFQYNTLVATTNGQAVFIADLSQNIYYIIDLKRDSIINYSAQTPTEIVYSLNNLFNLPSSSGTPQAFVAQNNADQVIATTNDLIKFQTQTSVSGSIVGTGVNSDTFQLPQGYIFRAEFSGVCNFSANGGKLLVEFKTDIDGILTTQNINRILPPTAPINPSENTTAVAIIDCTAQTKVLSLKVNSFTNLNYLYGSSVTTLATLIIHSI